MPYLIDSHCHLHFPAYDQNRAEILARMQAQDVWAITIGTTLDTSRSAIGFAEATEGVWASVGYHPEHFTSSFHDEAEGNAGTYSIDELERIARSSKKVVAIGETGLDFYRIDEGQDVDQAKYIQEQAFREQIALASKLEVPVIIHCRNALTRLAEIIREEMQEKQIKGVVHCYTGTWTEAQPLLDLGLFLSFTGIITFPPRKADDSEQHTHRVIERMPLDRMLIETDAPYLTPVPFRGQQNEPSYVGYVAEKIATLRQCSSEQIAQATMHNARTFFGI